MKATEQAKCLTVRLVLVNATKGYRFCEEDPYETCHADKGSLFRAMQREFGRCASTMYVDKKDGKTLPVGWVFQKRMRYEDARTDTPNDYYIREAWVEVSR